MFKNVKDPKFLIVDYSINKQRVYLKWKMTFFAFKSLQTIEGMSELLLNDFGKVVFHRDYWDSLSGLFIKIPLIGLHNIASYLTNFGDIFVINFFLRILKLFTL